MKRALRRIPEVIPWGVHRISDIYHPDVGAGMPDGRYVAAVCEPYDGNRLKAAWWILTGRAYAFLWPKPGDLEAIWKRDQPKPRPVPMPFKPVKSDQWMA